MKYKLIIVAIMIFSTIGIISADINIGNPLAKPKISKISKGKKIIIIIPTTYGSPSPTDSPVPTQSPIISPKATPTPTDLITATTSPKATPIPTDSPTATTSPKATPIPTDSPTATTSPNSTDSTVSPNSTVAIPTPADSPTTTVSPNSTVPIPTPADSPTTTVSPNSTDSTVSPNSTVPTPADSPTPTTSPNSTVYTNSTVPTPTPADFPNSTAPTPTINATNVTSNTTVTNVTSNTTATNTAQTNVTSNTTVTNTVQTNTNSGGGGGGSTSSGSSGGGVDYTGDIEPYSNILYSYAREENLIYGNIVEYPFNFTELSIYKVLVNGKQNEYDVQVRIESLKNVSAYANSTFPGNLYRYENVLIGSKRINYIGVDFKVKNSWLADISEGNLYLMEWNGTDWARYVPKMTNKDDLYTYFDSPNIDPQTSNASFSLSMFAIGGLPADKANNTKVENPAGKLEKEETVSTEVTPAKTSGFTIDLAIIGLFLLLLFRKYKREYR
jgi:PGF-pre-PGF domain-containing protein